jgi:glycosyltransferase involved in cell wall biosynthesis
MAPSSPFSIITPVYNEEAIIVEAVNKNLQVMESAGVEYEMIIVNDSSADASAALLNTHFYNHPKIKIFHHTANQGFGGAVKTGIENTRNTYLLCVPADSPLTDKIFNDFKTGARKADIVASYRIAQLGYTPRMRLFSYVYHFLIEIMFDIHLQDFNWIHLYHRKIFDEGKIQITSQGIFMLAEVLIKAQRKGYTFYEIPVVQPERLTGVASASRFSVIMKTIGEMVAFKYRGEKNKS